MLRDCKIGEGTTVGEFADLYKCTIGEDCKIHNFVFIEEGVTVGNRCVIKPFVFLCSGVQIEDDVFVGPGVTFVNDRYPKANNPGFKLEKTFVKSGVSIGANSVVMCGITIGRGSMIGANSLVLHDVPDNVIVVGNPAHRLRVR